HPCGVIDSDSGVHKATPDVDYLNEVMGATQNQARLARCRAIPHRPVPISGHRNLPDGGKTAPLNKDATCLHFHEVHGDLASSTEAVFGQSNDTIRTGFDAGITNCACGREATSLRARANPDPMMESTKVTIVDDHVVCCAHDADAVAVIRQRPR